MHPGYKPKRATHFQGVLEMMRQFCGFFFPRRFLNRAIQYRIGRSLGILRYDPVSAGISVQITSDSPRSIMGSVLLRPYRHTAHDTKISPIGIGGQCRREPRRRGFPRCRAKLPVICSDFGELGNEDDY